MTSPRLVGALLIAVAWSGSTAGTAQCHLHAPADYPSFSRQPLVIPRVGEMTQCEALNLERFSRRGRCHCSSDRVPDNGGQPLDPLAVPVQGEPLG